MNNMKTILIIDDMETNVNTLMSLLDDKYDILASLDGEGALDILEDEEKIDLILLDILMPEMDGFEVCRRLKSNSKTKDIPVIFITSDNSENTIEKAYEMGGIDYITKPFKARELFSRINTHLLASEQKNLLEKALQTNISLLNQYKDVVDISTIVSKTDLQGKITYVNDAFTKISGYTRDELLGKSHNIVRHPDVPTDVFKDLWKTIKSKHMWQGEVKNLKKDGSYYVVQSVIIFIFLHFFFAPMTWRNT